MRWHSTVVLASCCLAGAKLAGVPPAPLAVHGEHNPEYFRQLLGMDLLSHPWLRAPTRAHGGSSAAQQIGTGRGIGGVVQDALALMDSDGDAALSPQELTTRAMLAAKVRAMLGAAKANPSAVYAAKALFRGGGGSADKNGDGLLSKAEVSSLDPFSWAKGHVSRADLEPHFHSVFALADVNGDGQLSDSEFVLLKAAATDPSVNWREVHAFDFVDAGVADVFRLVDGKVAGGNGKQQPDGKLSRAELQESFALFGTVGGGRKKDEL